MSNFKKINLLKGVTIGGGASVYDDDYVTAPKGKINIKNYNYGRFEKPFSKVDKKNISSEISLGIDRGDDLVDFH